MVTSNNTDRMKVPLVSLAAYASDAGYICATFTTFHVEKEGA